MVSVITGVCLGVAMGAIAGEGMDVVKDSNGKRKLKGIDLKEGFRKANENIVPVALAGAAMFGTVTLCQAVGEDIQNKINASEEYYDNKRDELLERTNNIIDEAIDLKLYKETQRYLNISDVLSKQNNEGLIKISSDTLEDIKGLNSFEMYGISCMTEEQIKKALSEDIRAEAEEIRQDTIELVKEGSWFELEILEEEFDLLQQNHKEFMDTELF